MPGLAETTTGGKANTPVANQISEGFSRAVQAMSSVLGRPVPGQTALTGRKQPQIPQGQEQPARKEERPVPKATSGDKPETKPEGKPLPEKTEKPKAEDLGNVTTKPGGGTRYTDNHPGVDIANDRGTPVPAFESGVVTEQVAGKRQGDEDYGNYVVITDRNGNKHRYSHLMKSLVPIGRPVRAGENLGLMGNTGNAYSESGKGDGTHVDYEIVDAFGKYVDPSKFVDIGGSA
jgi:murein DD-endopeptidase MepM/ murein hydrolase activator NlpD